MKALLILTLVGQCYAGNRGYAQQRGYGYTPTYYQQQQQIYYAPYVEKVKFVAVETPGYDYYAALAAASSRSYERFQEYAQVPQQAALTYSIPSQPQPVQVAQQPVYQAQAPVKQEPVAQVPVQQATPQQPVYAAPQQPVAQATPQYQVQQQASPQQPVYAAPAKAPPIPSSTPGAPGKSYDGGVPPPPPPIIQQQRLDYSTAMGDVPGEVPPPPPTPVVPQAYQQQSQQQTYLRPTPVVSAVNSHFLSNVTKNCASCHTGAKSKGGFTIFDYPGRLASLSQEDLQEIADQVASRKMPYKRVMSEADRRSLLGMLGGNVSSLVSR